MKSEQQSEREKSLALFKAIATDTDKHNLHWGSAARAYLDYEGPRPVADFLIRIARDKEHKRSREMAFQIIH